VNFSDDKFLTAFPKSPISHFKFPISRSFTVRATTSGSPADNSDDLAVARSEVTQVKNPCILTYLICHLFRANTHRRKRCQKLLRMVMVDRGWGGRFLLTAIKPPTRRRRSIWSSCWDRAALSFTRWCRLPSSTPSSSSRGSSATYVQRSSSAAINTCTPPQITTSVISSFPIFSSLLSDCPSKRTPSGRRTAYLLDY